MGKLGIYLVACFPSSDVFLQGVRACEEAKVDFLEVGFPFSDPVADGDVIEKAAQASLTHYASDDFFAALREARAIFSRKLYVMTYSNVIYASGLDAFISRAGSVDGLILADLPLREMPLFRKNLKGKAMNMIPFLSPESRPGDITSALQQARDFVYFVSKRGTTGGAFHLDDETRQKIEQVRGKGIEVHVGFGIRNREDIAAAWESADGAIIGTRAVAELEQGIDTFRDFLKTLGLPNIC